MYKPYRATAVVYIVNNEHFVDGPFDRKSVEKEIFYRSQFYKDFKPAYLINVKEKVRK